MFYTCTAELVCDLFPTLGESCSGTCSGPAYCDGGTCAAQKPAGQPCTYPDECTTAYCAGSRCSEVPVCF